MGRILVFCAVFVFSLAGQLEAAQSARPAGFSALRSALAPLKTADLLGALIADTPEGDLPPAMLAQFFYLRRQFDLAAFYFMLDADLDPANAASRANLAGVLVELNAADSSTYPDAVLEWALENARAAARQRPQDAAINNTLAFVLEAWAPVSGSPDKTMAEALAAAVFATGKAPEVAEYWATLARLKKATGDEKGAAAALAGARRAGPDSLGYYVSALNLGQTPRPAPETTQTGGQSSPQTCNVDFKCEQICPKSIIGQVNLVSCKLENDTQLKNCNAGKKYATAYNCVEEFPIFSSLPGLSSVTSICVPGLCFHIRAVNLGKIDFRLEAGPNLGPLTPYLKVDGTWQNKNGFSVLDVERGIKFSLLNKAGVGKLASDHAGIAPGEIKLSKAPAGPQRIDGAVMARSFIRF